MNSEKFKIVDVVEIRKVNMDNLPENPTEQDLLDNIDYSDDGLIQKTICNPTILQRIKRKLGLFHYLDDAAMNYEIQRLATSIYNTYSHVSVGISSASGSDYTLTDLISPVLTRSVASKSYITTYIADDTVQMLGVFTPDGTYTIVETGLHDASISGNMGYRQTSCSISTTSGVPFAILWKVTIARG